MTVFGDSKIIIDWINNESTLRVLELENWCTRNRYLKDSFITIRCQHIYGEHNHNVDGLSKEALLLTSGHLTLMEFFEGDMIFADTCQIFV